MSKIVCDAPSTDNRTGQRPFTKWDDEKKSRLRAMFEAGVVDVEIAEAFNTSPSAIERQRAFLGLRRFAGEWTPERLETAKAMWAAGASDGEIARAIGGHLSRSAVHGRMKRLGLSRPKLAMTNRDRRVRTKHPTAPRGRPPKPRAASSTRGQTLEPYLPPINAFEPLPGGTDKPWVERRGGECKWPLDVGAEVHSCCRPVSRSGYCVAHAQIAFRTDQAVSPKRFAKSLRRYA